MIGKLSFLATFFITGITPSRILLPLIDLPFMNDGIGNAKKTLGLLDKEVKEFAKSLDDYKKALNLNPDYRKILTPRLKKIALELEKKH